MSQTLLTTSEAAEYLRKSPYWLLANRKKLSIPSMKVGGEYRYRREELDAWLEGRRTIDVETESTLKSKGAANRKVQLV